GVVVVGDGDEQVGLVDVLFQQQVAVGGAAVQDHAAVQMVGQVAAACGIQFDDLDLAAAFDGFGQPFTNVTTAGNHYLAVAVFRALQFVHHGADLVAGGNEEHLVTHFDHGAADQLERVVAAKNGCHSHVGIGQVIAQFAQLVADQHAAI